jgi:4-amino-4-deoxy-L-arabinose transferase-like glycosyltransferase
VEARTAKTDAALFASILAAQGVLAGLWLRRDTREALGLGLVLLFWGALGVGILLKGPIILLVTGSTILWLSVAVRGVGWLAPLRPKLGLPVMLALVAPWLILITIKTHGSFFAESVGHDMMAKVAGGQESKGFPPGYYTLLFPVTFWPWSLLALPAIPWVWNNRRDPAVLYCLAWIIPSWLVFEAVPTKLFHYILPTYAAIALLTARAVLDGFGKARPWLTGVAAVLFALIALTLTGGMAALPAVAEKRFDPLSILLALVTLAVLAFGVVLYRRGWLRRSIAMLTAGAFGLYLLAFQFVFPQLETIWLSPRIAEAVERARPCPNGTLVSVGFTEPSLVFLTGTGTVLTGDGAAAAKALAEDACALALVDQKQNQAFLDQAILDGVQPISVETISGFNYSRGKSLILSLFRR